MTREVMQIRQRQDPEVANNNVATIETELQILGTYWQQASKDFAKLNDNFPEFDVDENGEPLESEQEREYERVKSMYKDQQRAPLIYKRTLVAEARAPATVNKLTGAQLADPIKKMRERLVTSMRAKLTDLEEAIERLPVMTSLIRI